MLDPKTDIDNLIEGLGYEGNLANIPDGALRPSTQLLGEIDTLTPQQREKVMNAVTGDNFKNIMFGFKLAGELAQNADHQELNKLEGVVRKYSCTPTPNENEIETVKAIQQRRETLNADRRRLPWNEIQELAEGPKITETRPNIEIPNASPLNSDLINMDADPPEPPLISANPPSNSTHPLDAPIPESPLLPDLFGTSSPPNYEQADPSLQDEPATLKSGVSYIERGLSRRFVHKSPPQRFWASKVLPSESNHLVTFEGHSGKQKGYLTIDKDALFKKLKNSPEFKGEHAKFDLLYGIKFKMGKNGDYSLEPKGKRTFFSKITKSQNRKLFAETNNEEYKKLQNSFSAFDAEKKIGPSKNLMYSKSYFLSGKKNIKTPAFNNNLTAYEVKGINEQNIIFRVKDPQGENGLLSVPKEEFFKTIEGTSLTDATNGVLNFQKGLKFSINENGSYKLHSEGLPISKNASTYRATFTNKSTMKELGKEYDAFIKNLSDKTKDDKVPDEGISEKSNTQKKPSAPIGAELISISDDKRTSLAPEDEEVSLAPEEKIYGTNTYHTWSGKTRSQYSVGDNIYVAGGNTFPIKFSDKITGQLAFTRYQDNSFRVHQINNPEVVRATLTACRDLDTTKGIKGVRILTGEGHASDKMKSFYKTALIAAAEAPPIKVQNLAAIQEKLGALGNSSQNKEVRDAIQTLQKLTSPGAERSFLTTQIGGISK